jgi:small GTP-binding protein
LFKRKTISLKITFCGLDNAGKTSIVNYLTFGSCGETAPTTGFTQKTINFPNISMDIIDLGGQTNYRNIWEHFITNSDGLVYVIDSSDSTRLDETKDIFLKIITKNLPSEMPILLLLNKTDRPNTINRIHFKRLFSFGELCEKYICACFETSAKTGEGIHEAFDWFVKALETNMK